jgi:DNA-binding beta-propeller fold protein YncE
MISRRAWGALAALVLGIASCSVIVGKDESSGGAVAREQVRILYVETLRSQASLRGESLNDMNVAGDPATSLQRPVGVFADPYRVYVTDRSPVPRLAVFDRARSTMTFLRIQQIPGLASNAQFLDPVAVALDQGGTIYVADAQQGSVFALDYNGAPLFTIGMQGQLAFPTGLAVDLRRNVLFVADKQAHRVQAYTLRGALLYDFRGPVPDKGEKGLASPAAIAVDRNGTSYVLDVQWNRVYQYDANGVFQRSFPVRSAERGRNVKPAGIAVDSAGHLYITDAQNNAVMIFGPDGAYLQSWGGTGSGHDAFWLPSGIFIDSRDFIYIADQMNGRVQVYQFLK